MNNRMNRYLKKVLFFLELTVILGIFFLLLFDEWCDRVTQVCGISDRFPASNSILAYLCIQHGVKQQGQQQ